MKPNKSDLQKFASFIELIGIDQAKNYLDNISDPIACLDNLSTSNDITINPTPLRSPEKEMPVEPTTTALKQLFIAHGKNHRPLEDLKKILDKFKIAYKVAVDAPHAGRPISKKVAQLMKECSGGVFIFTKDEMFSQDDKDVWRPSENVVYELGAGTILWENKIIILREEGVNFPSDFNDLGYITFQNGDLSNKAMDLFMELIAMGLIKVQPA